jgi:hypothetical protein
LPLNMSTTTYANMFSLFHPLSRLDLSTHHLSELAFRP